MSTRTVLTHDIFFLDKLINALRCYRESFEEECLAKIESHKFLLHSEIRELEIARFYKEWVSEQEILNPERIRYHALQEEISQLKERISKLVSKKFSIDNVSMAQANPDPVDVILTNRTAISNSL
ncbi:9863_t:CDS:2 [Rhizophagus irregularis]|nr:9863_t:CDS:2 [Rhizophagus irregularis]